MRRAFIAGNWKMNTTAKEAKELVSQIQQQLPENVNVDIAICPPFVNLAEVCSFVKENDSKEAIKVGGQNIHWETSGAFTGEISATMLKEIGCSFVILGHSERRALFGESSETVSKKAIAALKGGLLPIVCVGETLEQREQEITQKVVQGQLEGSLSGLTPAQIEAVTIAYEPVWAIGTGKTASPEIAQEVHAFIRSFLSTNYDNSIAQSVRIQYGGSVKPGNIKELIAQKDIDGALVGGASLKANDFVEIIKSSDQ